jgi:hypothetical protein
MQLKIEVHLLLEAQQLFLEVTPVETHGVTGVEVDLQL